MSSVSRSQGVHLTPLLRAIDTSVRRLGTDDHLVVAQYLERVKPGDEAVLRAGVASLLACNEDQWKRIHHLAGEYLRGGIDVEGRATGRLASEVSGGFVGEGEVSQGVSPRARKPARETRWERLRAWGTRRPPWVWLVALTGFVVCGVLATWVWTLPAEEILVLRPMKMPIRDTGVKVELKPEPPPAPSMVEIEPKKPLPYPFLNTQEMGSLLWLSAAALVLLVVGYRLRRLHQVAPQERKLAHEKLDRAAQESYAKLQDQHRSEGFPAFELYHLEAPSPLGNAALSESADWLGSIRQGMESRDLDVPGSVARNIQAGGRTEVCFADRSVSQAVLMLVDDEADTAGPYRKRAHRLAERFKSAGLEVQVCTFEKHPDRKLQRGKVRLRFADLARAARGQPLLFVSPALEPFDRGKDRDWLSHLGAWPRRAWIDPDPLALKDERRAEATRAMDQHGLQRFPLTDAGVQAASARLAGLPSRVEARDPVLEEGPALDQALERWAIAAALVPEPTWDQLETFRRAFPELNKVLTDASAVRWLLRWAAERPENKGVSIKQDGEQLHMDAALTEVLLDKAADQARTDPAMRVYVQELNRMLEQQLRSVEPGEGLAKEFWKLRLNTVLARLNPAEAKEHLLELIDSPLRHQVVPLLEGEVRRQGKVPDEMRWRDDVRRAVEAARTSTGVRVVDLLWGARAAWPSWKRGVLWGLALAAFAGGLALLPALNVDVGLTRMGSLPTVRRVELPNVEEPKGQRRTWPATQDRPAMIEIFPGTFSMGSPQSEDGRSENETLHEVTLTRPFAMSTTEVTQAQFEKVMGTNPSATEYKGVSLKAPNYPVQNLTWLEAVTFCNKLSEIEGFTAAYTVADENVAWPNKDADGYRLPTEAEWEYAARAGGKDVYAGTSKVGDLCTIGNVADATAKKSFPDWSWTTDCTDGHAGLAPVASFAANGWGLFDMTGNVWEWTWDWYEKDLKAATDPSGPESGGDRVNRGGSWVLDPRYARVANRGWGSASNRDYSLGFRLSRSLLPSSL